MDYELHKKEGADAFHTFRRWNYSWNYRVLRFFIDQKKSDNLFFAQIPGYLGIVASLVLFIIGYVYVRGFGGAAYILCALPIFIFSTIVFLKVRK